MQRYGLNYEKRFVVMDIFHSDQTEPVGEWNEFSENNKPKNHGKYLVKLDNNAEVFAYYCWDVRNFFECKTRDYIENVKMWKSLKE